MNISVIKFSTYLGKDDMTVNIATNMDRFPGNSIRIKNPLDEQFPDVIRDRMHICLSHLFIENASPTAVRAIPVNPCFEQQFSLSYPEECTSLLFIGNWKRGQTVAEAKWTFTYFEKPVFRQCVNWKKMSKYSPEMEFTDRHIQIKERQLHPGINRICNQFLFTTTFTSSNNNLHYGPYLLNICVCIVFIIVLKCFAIIDIASLCVLNFSALYD